MSQSRRRERARVLVPRNANHRNSRTHLTYYIFYTSFLTASDYCHCVWLQISRSFNNEASDTFVDLV